MRLTSFALLAALVLPCAAETSKPHQQKKLLPKQSAAKAALDRELKAGSTTPCHATNTRDALECQGKVIDQAQHDYDEFYSDLKSLLGSDDHGLESANQLWLKYRQSSCDAINAFYRPGTYANEAYGKCMITLTRDRMRELDAIYYTVLHD